MKIFKCVSIVALTFFAKVEAIPYDYKQEYDSSSDDDSPPSNPPSPSPLPPCTSPCKPVCPLEILSAALLPSCTPSTSIQCPPPCILPPQKVMPVSSKKLPFCPKTCLQPPCPPPPPLEYPLQYPLQYASPFVESSDLSFPIPYLPPCPPPISTLPLSTSLPPIPSSNLPLNPSSCPPPCILPPVKLTEDSSEPDTDCLLTTFNQRYLPLLSIPFADPQPSVIPYSLLPPCPLPCENYPDCE